MTAKKNDSCKADLSLIPRVALTKAAEAFAVGERKYGRYNFYKGMEASRVIAALLRHATSWMEGEDRDPEDGQHHLGSVIACASMILKMEELGTLQDNRFSPIEEVRIDEEAVLEKIDTIDMRAGDITLTGTKMAKRSL